MGQAEPDDVRCASGSREGGDAGVNATVRDGRPLPVGGGARQAVLEIALKAPRRMASGAIRHQPPTRRRRFPWARSMWRVLATGRMGASGDSGHRCGRPACRGSPLLAGTWEQRMELRAAAPVDCWSRRRRLPAQPDDPFKPLADIAKGRSWPRRSRQIPARSARSWMSIWQSSSLPRPGGGASSWLMPGFSRAWTWSAPAWKR